MANDKLVPIQSSYGEFKDQVHTAFRSGLLPKSVDTPEKAIAIALTGRELGLKPMESLNGLYVVNGKVSMSAQLMLRLIYERVPGALITVLAVDDNHCEVEMARPNQPPQRFHSTLEEAKHNGSMNKPIWKLHTQTMLRWAAIRTGARIVFADAIAGCYMPDEIEEPRVIHREPPKQTTIGLDSPHAMALREGVKVPDNLMPWEKTEEESGLDRAMIPHGKYQGTLLKHRTPADWEIYMLEVQKTLKERDLSVRQKQEAIEIIDTIKVYLEYMAVEQKQGK